MVSSVVLSPFVKGVKEFQQLGLVNKGVMDIVALDVPLLVLAKNETERKERFVRQLLILGIAFVFAPLHGRVFSNFFARGIGTASQKLNQKLMQIPFRSLSNTKQLQQGVKTLFEKQLKEKIPGALEKSVNEGMRQKIVRAKTHFLMLDLATCGLMLSSVGFIKVLFGRMLSGKKQFSGEFGIVGEKTLDKIYQKEEAQKTNLPKHFKEALTFALGLGVPVLMGLLLKHQFLKGRPDKVSGFLSKHLDYNYPQYTPWLKGWPMLSDGAQVLLSLLLTTGELASSRSVREFKELAIQRNAVDALFFFGTPAFMKILSGSTTVQGAIDQVRSRTPKIIQQVAGRAAWTYLASFALDLAAVAAIVTITNNVTRKAVKVAADKLTHNNQPTPVPTMFKLIPGVQYPIYPYVMPYRYQRPYV